MNAEIQTIEARLEVAERNVRTALLNIDARLPTLYQVQGVFDTMLRTANTADQRVATQALVDLTAGYIDMMVGLRKELTKA